MRKISSELPGVEDRDISAAQYPVAHCFQHDIAQKEAIHSTCNTHHGQNIITQIAVTLHENFMKRRA
jgi:hypothetical protein